MTHRGPFSLIRYRVKTVLWHMFRKSAAWSPIGRLRITRRYSVRQNAAGWHREGVRSHWICAVWPYIIRCCHSRHWLRLGHS